MPPTPRPRILALPATRGVEDVIRTAAAQAGFDARVTDSPSAFLAEVSRGPWAATLVSLAHDAMDAALVERIGEQPGTGALLLTAPGVSLEVALLMERCGAVALLNEPVDRDELAGHLSQLEDEGEVVPLAATPGTGLTAGEGRADGGPTLVGSDPAMADALRTLVRAAPTPSTVLITGESGTGKEVAARVLHWASPRKDGPFVAVNCAAIPENLLESELFGHEKGAFTGAVARRTGRFERAHGGTLFLDEIGDMSPVLQAKILRALEERRVEPVGAAEGRAVDVRIVAATNQPLREHVAEGTFREDLFYRLAVVELELPPLRDRGDDLVRLTAHFAREFGERYGREMRGITRAALDRMRAHSWPGNVRELRNVVDRAVVLATDDLLRAAHLRIGAGSPRASGRAPGADSMPYPATLSLAEVESAHIGKVLRSVEGHMGQAAEILGIHRNTLTRKVREYGLEDVT